MTETTVKNAANRRGESVGVVETRIVELPLPAGGFPLESGATLPRLQVAYESYGTLAPTRDNVIYICHALTGDAHVAGVDNTADAKPGWWDELVGPGRGIDTNRFHVICSNILGGCKGTTGPSSLSPLTGKPYGSSFPEITVGDMVNVQRALLQHLGLEHLHAVIGGSLGGMQVVEWGIRYPDRVDLCVCIASAMRLSAQALAFDIVGRNAIKTDPHWHNGDFYEHGSIPEPGLAQARMIGHITYLSAEMMSKKFGREKRDDKRFQVESYLEYQGQKFVNRFDANSYIHITRAMDVFDVEESYGSIDAAMARVKSRFLVVALSSDWLFPPEQSLELSTALVRATKSVSYCLLHAPHGHDAFLVDIEHLSDVVGKYLVNFAPCKNAVPAAPDVPPAADAQRDYDMIEQFVRPRSRVIDIGCGDGALLARLATRRQAQTLGLDIDLNNLIQVLARGQDVIQCDVDEGLAMVPDNAFDYAILSQTLQVVRKPRHVLREMLRVAREGIVSFPNFGQWSNRLHVGVLGRMPKSRTLPYEWYNTPNIHLSTLRDFCNLCRAEKIRILDVACTPSGLLGRLFLALGLKNLGADRVLVRITKG